MERMVGSRPQPHYAYSVMSAVLPVERGHDSQFLVWAVVVDGAA